jgi:DNA polymerase III sliding clamp (beta) subunit (PCNA family)
MKVKLETKTLKNLVTRVMKGVGNNDSMMRTCWIGIKCAGNTLSMTAWDGENYLQVSEDKVVCDDFKVTVTADKFAQLISKTTCEEVTLELKDTYLKMKGNGDYKLELPVNDEGELDVYPEISFDFKKAKHTKIKLSSIVWALQSNKVSLAKTPELPHLMCYYFGDEVLTTNNTTAGMSVINVFNEPVMLKSDLVNLIATMENEDIDTYFFGEKIALVTPKTTIVGYCNESKAEFEDSVLEGLKGLFEQESPASCVVEKDKLLGILDRIMLFVKTKEEGVRVLFTKQGIQFYNKDQSVNELLPYKQSNNFVNFEEKLQLDVLKELVTAVCEDDCYIQYGVEGFLKIGKEKRQHLLTVLAEEGNE